MDQTAGVDLRPCLGGIAGSRFVAAARWITALYELWLGVVAARGRGSAQAARHQSSSRGLHVFGRLFGAVGRRGANVAGSNLSAPRRGRSGSEPVWSAASGLQSRSDDRRAKWEDFLGRGGARKHRAAQGFDALTRIR